MKYSVLLLYPDYLSDAYGQETYFTNVIAKTPRQASNKARREAYEANKLDKHTDPETFPEDFHCLAVIRGHHTIQYDDGHDYPEDQLQELKQSYRRIVATVKLSYAPNRAEVLTYRPSLKSATSEIVSIDGDTKRYIRKGYGLNNIDPCTFLDCLGIENRNGRLIDVKTYRSDD